MNRDDKAANTLLLAFSGLSILLLCLPLSGKVQFIRAVASYLLDPIPFNASRAHERLSNMPSDAARLIGVDIKLREAQRQLQETAYLRSEVESLRAENARLLIEAGMKPESGKVIRWARIMERDPVNWHRSVMISVGAEDGVELNAPVLGLQEARLGVIGRVTEVGRRSSKVLLLSDELSAVAAHLPEKSWEGLVQGQGAARLRMNYLPVEAEFGVGESVYTSPTSATFPSGLLIGSISRVFERDPFLAFQSVEITPAVSASSLKEAMILLPMTGAAGLPASPVAPGERRTASPGGAP